MNTNELSPIKKAALEMWEKVRDLILSPECDDDAVLVASTKINILNKDAFREEDYLSYDDAIKELGIGYNRNKLSDLAKKHGIKNHKFKHFPAGFHRDDIAKLKLILAMEQNKTTTP